MRWKNEKEGQRKESQKVKEVWGPEKERGEKKEEEKKKNVNNLWVYEKQHVPYACTSDCCFVLFCFLSHRCHQMTKYRIRIQA